MQASEVEIQHLLCPPQQSQLALTGEILIELNSTVGPVWHDHHRYVAPLQPQRFYITAIYFNHQIERRPSFISMCRASPHLDTLEGVKLSTSL